MSRREAKRAGMNAIAIPIQDSDSEQRKKPVIKRKRPLPQPVPDEEEEEEPVIVTEIQQHKSAGATKKKKTKIVNDTGLYLTTALTRRVIEEAVKKAAARLRIENARIKSRLEKRGKPVPRNLEVPESIHIASACVQLSRGVFQVNLDKYGERCKIVREHAGRETLLVRDAEVAKLLLQ